MISNRTQKEYNTHNSTLRPFRCSNSRPCNRDQTCDYCLNRRIAFVCEQIEPFVGPDGLCCFATVSLPACDDVWWGIDQLGSLRSKHHAIIKKFGGYVTVLAIGEKDGAYIPHLHSLVGNITKEDLERALVRRSAIPGLNVQVIAHTGDLKANAFRRIGYMFKQNYRPTIKYRRERLRLLSASRGILVGRRNYAMLKGQNRWQ